MKKVISVLLILLILLAVPFAAAAEDILTIIPPTKTVYTVGQTLDFSGGSIILPYIEPIPLTAAHCSGYDTSTPGIKTVSVTYGDMADIIGHFNIVVLSKNEPITAMEDIRFNHWAYPYFGPTMKAGLFRGVTATSLKPDAPITRAEMATLIYRVWKGDPSVMTNQVSGAAFQDVPTNHWAYQAIHACRKAGILKGVGDNRFNPDAPILRQDAILMLMRIQYTEAELAAVNVSQTVAASGIPATDFGRVSDYAKAAVALALGDLIEGNPNGTIAPLSSITRAESAAIFCRKLLSGYNWVPPVTAPIIYLSPSRQFSNSYAAGNTNEGDQMYKVADRLKVLLEAEGYQVIIAKKNQTIYERPNLAKDANADLYVPIHSNAGGGRGTRIFYNGARSGSYELSRAIFDHLGKLTNTPLNSTNLKEDYLCLLPNGAPFHEVMHPTMPMAYLEVEFHDNATGARWIINNTDAIARAIADGIIDYCEKYLI